MSRGILIAIPLAEFNFCCILSLSNSFILLITFLFLYGCRQQFPQQHKDIAMLGSSPSRHAECRVDRDLLALFGVFHNAMPVGGSLYLRFSSVFLKLSLLLKKFARMPYNAVLRHLLVHFPIKRSGVSLFFQNTR